MFCLINLDNGEAMLLPQTASAVEHGDHSSWQSWEMHTQEGDARGPQRLCSLAPLGYDFEKRMPDYDLASE